MKTIVYDGTNKSIHEILWNLGKEKAKEVRKVGNILVIPIAFIHKKPIRKAVRIGDSIVFGQRDSNIEIVKMEANAYGI